MSPGLLLILHLVVIVCVGAFLWWLINWPELALPALPKKIATVLFIAILVVVLFVEVFLPLLGLLSGGAHTRLW